MRRTYGEMARALGVEFCFGMERSGSYCHAGDHRLGFATPGRVHLFDQPPRWGDLHRFLKLVANALDPTIDEAEPWARVYRQNLSARALGHRIHIRVPARYLRFDRAFVKASVAGLPNETPLRKEAYDWARR